MPKFDRLLDNFKPDHYKLSLEIDRPGRKFSGQVVINGQATQTGLIKLHAKHLAIKSARLKGQDLDFKMSSQDCLLLRSQHIKNGAVVLEIEFTGQINDSMHGMYPCYFKHGGQEKELIATQFESHHAREVFPCIDEPAAKATFDVTLKTETGVSVLGNMPIKSQSQKDNRLTTHFETTPRMSSYLLAWVYGEIHSKSTKTKRGTEVNIWATTAQDSAGFDFALDVAKRGIEFFEDYFNVNYPLPKSDHIALPDFYSAAMENWGLITYRESCLLAPPDTTSLDTKKEIAQVIIHELAHQWFGNLVTMEWWDDLWLNESFAKMMEYFVTDKLFPDWDMWLHFTARESAYSLRRDSLDGVQPVKIAVNSPDEISSIFDPAIVYAKGAKLIKMMFGYVGEAAFQKALSAYFKEHAYKNAIGNDLWQAMSKASGKDISEFMNAWLSQPGFPLVGFEADSQGITLSQKRFFVGPHQPSKNVWPIPLDATNQQLPELLEDKSAKVKTSSTKPTILNQNDTGHFIAKYDQASLEKILISVKKGQVSDTLRTQLLNDYVLLARSGDIPSDQLIDIVAAYQNESAHQIWDAVFATLLELRKFVVDDELAESKLKQLCLQLAEKQYKRLGWHKQPNESENDSQLRATTLSMVLYAEMLEAIEEAHKVYRNLALTEIDPDIRSIVLSTVGKHGPEEILDDMISLYKETHLSDLKEDLTLGITSTKSQNKIDSVLKHLQNNKFIKPQDVGYWYIFMIRNKHARDKTWQWLRSNWDWVEQTFGSDKSYDMFPRYSAYALYTKAHLQEFEEFFSPMLSNPGLKRTIEMGIGEIKGRIELIERDGQSVRDRLINL